RGAPLLLPTRNHAIRGRLDHWFELHDVRPDVVGEFDDNAMMNTFARHGLGLFPAPLAFREEAKTEFNAVPVGELTGVHEQFYAISNESKITHPAVEAILSASHGDIFRKRTG